VTAPVFCGPAGRQWRQAGPGDAAAGWTMGVRVDEISEARFVREPCPFLSLPAPGACLVV